MIAFCRPGFNPEYQPHFKHIRFVNVDFNHVPYKIRQKYRLIEHELINIRNCSSLDIRLLVDNDSSVLLDFDNNKVLFNFPNHESVSCLMFMLDQVKTMYYYDRYPESIITVSQFNHYKSLISKYYGTDQKK